MEEIQRGARKVNQELPNVVAPIELVPNVLDNAGFDRSPLSENDFQELPSSVRKKISWIVDWLSNLNEHDRSIELICKLRDKLDRLMEQVHDANKYEVPLHIINTIDYVLGQEAEFPSFKLKTTAELFPGTSLYAECIGRLSLPEEINHQQQYGVRNSEDLKKFNSNDPTLEVVAYSMRSINGISNLWSQLYQERKHPTLNSNNATTVFLLSAAGAIFASGHNAVIAGICSSVGLVSWIGAKFLRGKEALPPETVSHPLLHAYNYEIVHSIPRGSNRMTDDIGRFARFAAKNMGLEEDSEWVQTFTEATMMIRCLRHMETPLRTIEEKIAQQLKTGESDSLGLMRQYVKRVQEYCKLERGDMCEQFVYASEYIEEGMASVARSRLANESYSHLRAELKEKHPELA